MRLQLISIAAASSVALALVVACGEPTTTDSGSTTTQGESESTTESGDVGSETADEPFTCDNPTPIMQAGTDTPSGFVECEGGFIHRVEAVACVQPQNPAANCESADPCVTNDDCANLLYGSCQWDRGEDHCGCVAGCATDADCPDGRICACAGVGSELTRCIPANCTNTDSCAEDALCGFSRYEDACSVIESLACAGPDVACRVVADCAPDDCSCMAFGGEYMCRSICGGAC